MTRNWTKALLIAFLALSNAAWMGLAMALIWTNATKPSPLVESCVAAEIKRVP